MGDEPATDMCTAKELRKALHAVHLRLPGFSTLFHGRDDDTFDAVCFELMAFGESAVEKRELVYTYFGSFFHHPFHAIGHLRGSHCQVDMSVPRLLLRPLFFDFIPASTFRHQREASPIEAAPSVDEMDFVATLQSQHSGGMHGLVGGQLSRKRFGGIEKANLFHFYLTSSFLGLKIRAKATPTTRAYPAKMYQQVCQSVVPPEL